VLFFRHPGYATLNRFADGELEPGEYRRVSAHLAECGRCRREVAFIRKAGTLARSLETPPPPKELLDRVLERRADGERVLLPLESPGATAPVHRRMVPAAAAATVLFVAGLFLTTGVLEADRGGLNISPEHPTAGQELTIRYDGGFEFAAEDVLELKARFRTGSGQKWEQIAAILERGDGGVFVASVDLPDSAVYAAFAVETLDGQTVDNNNRQLWDVMVFGSDGRPTKQALWERYTDLFDRGDQIQARETARNLTELYPESPRGWAASWYIDGERFKPLGDTDSVAQQYRGRFRLLERGLTQDPPADPDELAILAFFGSTLGEYASAEYWLRQAETRGARSAAVYQTRTYLLEQEDGKSPSELLRGLESIWHTAPFPVPQVADRGWAAAVRSGDWDAVMRWLPRYRDTRGPRNMAAILVDMQAAFPAGRILDWALETGQDALFRPSHRGVGQPKWAHARVDAEVRQEGLARLAELALTAGRRRVARAFALQAVPLAWETNVLEGVARTLLATGDTAGARVAWARAAADPMGARPPVTITDSGDWPVILRAARSELTRYVLRESMIRFADTELGTPGRPVVAAFDWSCRRLAEHFPEVAGALGDATMELVLVPAIGLSDQPSCATPAPVRLDWKRDISRDYGVRGLPSYFVIDAEGRVRFVTNRLNEVPRQLAALRTITSPGITD